MSVLGPAGMGAWNVASSVAGSQRNPAATDRVQADQAQQKLHADHVQLTTRELDGEQSHNEVADRDADGREAWEFKQRPQQPDEDPAESTDAELKPPPEDERGHTLDLDA